MKYVYDIFCVWCFQIKFDITNISVIIVESLYLGLHASSDLILLLIVIWGITHLLILLFTLDEVGSSRPHIRHREALRVLQWRFPGVVFLLDREQSFLLLGCVGHKMRGSSRGSSTLLLDIPKCGTFRVNLLVSFSPLTLVFIQILSLIVLLRSIWVTLRYRKLGQALTHNTHEPGLFIVTSWLLVWLRGSLTARFILFLLIRATLRTTFFDYGLISHYLFSFFYGLLFIRRVT